MATPPIKLRVNSARPSIKRAQSSRIRATHQEFHSDHGEIVRDIIIGFADGLTVPFALTAGLSSYVLGPIFLSVLA